MGMATCEGQTHLGCGCAPSAGPVVTHEHSHLVLSCFAPVSSPGSSTSPPWPTSQEGGAMPLRGSQTPPCTEQCEGRTSNVCARRAKVVRSGVAGRLRGCLDKGLGLGHPAHAARASWSLDCRGHTPAAPRAVLLPRGLQPLEESLWALQAWARGGACQGLRCGFVSIMSRGSPEHATSSLGCHFGPQGSVVKVSGSACAPARGCSQRT